MWNAECETLSHPPRHTPVDINANTNKAHCINVAVSHVFHVTSLPERDQMGLQLLLSLQPHNSSSPHGTRARAAVINPRSFESYVRIAYQSVSTFGASRYSSWYLRTPGACASPGLILLHRAHKLFAVRDTVVQTAIPIATHFHPEISSSFLLTRTAPTALPCKPHYPASC